MLLLLILNGNHTSMYILGYNIIVNEYVWCFRSHVRIISSNRGGMGKSLFIKRMAQRLKQECKSQESVYAVIPIHGPLVTSDVILKFFMGRYEDDKCMIYHLDIAPSVRQLCL